MSLSRKYVSHQSVPLVTSMIPCSACSRFSLRTIARETTADSLIYAANRAPEIAGSIVAVDEAMRWGFNFDMGSFEVWDVLLQHPETLQKVMAGRELPELVQRVQTAGQGT